MPQLPRALPADPDRHAGTTARRLLGIGLLGLVYLPVHRLLDPATTGLAGSSTRAIADSAWALGLWGTVTVLGLSFALAILVPADPRGAFRRMGRALARRRATSFALSCGALALLSAAVVARFVFHGQPTSVDEMVQLLHARALLAGSPVLPLPADPAAWVVQNSLVRGGGWASVYPPLHTLLLAAGLAVHAWWLVGPVATGVLVTATALALDRLLPGYRGAARGASVVLALSPFLVFLGATGLSHASAGALAALTLLAALAAREGSWGWSVLAGAAVGAFVCARPWTGIVVGAALVASTWLPAARRRRRPARWVLARLAGLAVGGIPFAALLFAWNGRLFGDPLRLGYVAAYGPAHGLGLHADPWGNVYGARQALAYTGADLVQLGVRLLESPLPALALVGLGLALLRHLPRGAGVLMAWALAGACANAAYWHHGVHFGPRLLFETTPAWVALWVVCVAGLSDDAGPVPPVARRTVSWAAVLSVTGGLLFVPGTAVSYEASPAALAASLVPTPPTTPALVFVHGSWSSRVVARLVAAGMRRDSVETALRRNDLCSVDRYARWRENGGPDTPPLDLRSLPGTPPGLSWARISRENRVLVRPGAPPGAECAREARSDRFGTVELEPLLWQAPPVRGGRVVLARDLGPEADAAVAGTFPGYRTWVLVDDAAGTGSRLLPYDDGMDSLWGGPRLTGRSGSPAPDRRRSGFPAAR